MMKTIPIHPLPNKPGHELRGRAYNPNTRRVPENETPEEAELRLQADIELHLHLALKGFDGRTWAAAEKKFVDYSYPVIAALIRDGRIFVQLANSKRKINLPAAPRELTNDEITDLTAMSVAVGLGRLKRGFQAGTWNPGKGASLTTTAVNKCIYAFIDEYKAFYKRTFQGPRYVLLDEAHHHTLPAPGRDPSAAMTWLGRLPVRLQTDENCRILELLEQEYKHVEIAAELNLTPKQVEHRVKRFRIEFDRYAQVVS
jgi:hypothetical protein